MSIGYFLLSIMLHFFRFEPESAYKFEQYFSTCFFFNSQPRYAYILYAYIKGVHHASRVFSLCLYNVPSKSWY